LGRNGRYYVQMTVEDSTTGIKRVERDRHVEIGNGALD
jgi:hypothetical protein